MRPSPGGDLSVLARQFRMREDEVQAWLDANDRVWALHNMKTLHRSGLSPAEGKVLYDHLDDQARTHISPLVDAGRMASLDVAHLHWWAAAGLLKPKTTDAPVSPRGRRGRAQVSFTRWVTEARRYIAATGGDQRRAAMMAAAGFSAEEATSADLDEEMLRTMIALNKGVRLDP